MHIVARGTFIRYSLYIGSSEVKMTDSFQLAIEAHFFPFSARDGVVRSPDCVFEDSSVTPTLTDVTGDVGTTPR